MAARGSRLKAKIRASRPRKKETDKAPESFRPPPSSDEQRALSLPSFLRVPCAAPGAVPDVDVLLCGAPFDAGAPFRPGARFAPRAVRAASASSNGFSAALGIDIHEELSIADGGDVAWTRDQEALEAIARRAEAIARSGVIAGFVGGSDMVTLAALRGIHRAKPRAVGLFHLSAKSGARASARGSSAGAGALELALNEGLIRGPATVEIGLRGPYSAANELGLAQSRGFESISTDDIKWDLHAAVSQIRKNVQKGAFYLSVDVGVLDPAFAPGAALPTPGGIGTWELQQILRALVGAEIVGFDVVELVPAHDPSGITAQVAVTILEEILAAIADTRRSGRPAPSSHVGRGRRLSP